MAIKGKTKSRRSGRHTGVSPRPRVEPKAPPLVRRTGFRLSVLGVFLAIGAIVATVLVAKSSAAGEIRDYDRELFAAHRPFLKHLDARNEESFYTLPGRVESRDASGQDLVEASQTWEADFGKARDEIRRLKAPEDLRHLNELFAVALEQYTEVARFYRLVGEERILADRTEDSAAKAGIEQHIEQMLERSRQMRTSARVSIDYARNQLELIKLDRGVKSVSPPLPGDPALLPPGASSGHG